jgi:hypothetical protein
MKQKIGILIIIIMLASLAAAQATVTLAPKTPSQTEKVVVLMFDDGWLSQYTNALPILQSYGFNASFSIYPKAQDGRYPDYMSWAQVESLAKGGYDVESHTYSHLDLINLSATILHSELVNSKQVLQQHGIQSGALIYPEGLGVDNETVKQATKDAGYLIARGVVDGDVDLSNPSLDYYALNCDAMGSNTNLAYFESNLYDVGGSNIAILLYHKIDNIDTAEESVTVDNFAQQMAYLHDNDFTVRSLSQVFFDITPLPTPTPTATPTPTPIPSSAPTSTPTPTALPPPPSPTTEMPTPTPTPKLPEPTATPIAPTENPTHIPPTPISSDNPTPTQTTTPTASPTIEPTNDKTTPFATQPSDQISSAIALTIVAVTIAGTLLIAYFLKIYASRQN